MKTAGMLALVAGVWVGLGLISGGGFNAFMRAQFCAGSVLGGCADRNARVMFGQTMVFGVLFGPIGLVATTMFSGGFADGLSYEWRGTRP